MKMKWLTLLGLLITGATALAQEQPNSVQYHAVHNPNSPYYVGSNQQPVAPPIRWADRWGAIAVAKKNPVVGVAANAASKHDAHRAALNDCQVRGGLGCKVQIEYTNQCSVLVVAGSQYNAARAATIEEATSIGMKICQEGNIQECRVYYSGCSLPVRVQ